MRYFFVAGEASGDAHGAELMSALRRLDPEARFFGAGGPRMARLAEPGFLEWTGHAVIGVVDVLKNYGYFRRQFRRLREEVREIRPDAVLFVDYPGFNLRLAAALRAGHYAGKLVFFISPQVWAWNRGRIPKMARLLDLMLCIFPFEPDLYRASGLRAEFVGHPLLEALARESGEVSRQSALVGLFPGSRLREVRKIFPVMAGAARILKQTNPGLVFEACAARPALADWMKNELVAQEADFVHVATGNAHDLMRRAGVAALASGTATLEATFFRLPFVLVYKVSWLTYLPARLLIRLDHIGITNILAGRSVVPELIQSHATPETIAAELETLLSSPEVRCNMLAAFDDVLAGLDTSGTAAANAAEAIYGLLR